jgi:hypothetical protein
MEIMDGDLCLTEDHEVLTKIGWVNLKTLVEHRIDVEVACWDSHNAEITWHYPVSYIKQFYQGKLYTFEGKVSIRGTANHKQPLMSNFGKFRRVRFEDLYTTQGANNRYIHSGRVVNSRVEDEAYLQLLAATQADGCFAYRGSSYLRFSFKKERKKIRLVNILRRLNLPFRDREEPNGYTHFYLSPSEFITQRLLKDLTYEKIFPRWLLDCRSDLIFSFVEELQYWDGKQEKLGNFSYFSNTHENIEIIQALCPLCGKYSAYSISETDCVSLYISEKSLSQDRATTRSVEDYIGDIYCITTPTNFFVCKRNNKVCITGNSGADAMVYGADSGCKNLMDFFANPKKFHPSGKLYAWVASEHLQREVSVKEDSYKLYKASHHGVWYGMQTEKLASTLGCSFSLAKSLMEFYNHIYPEKEKWHEKIQRNVKLKGYITNIFGRRGYFLNTNDATLWNKAFSFIPQSTIADVINRAWVKIAQELNMQVRDMYEDTIVYEEVSSEEEFIQVLMQVHDSLVLQYPVAIAEKVREPIRQSMLIPLPYDPPFSIPSDFKVSASSYGECGA